MLQPLNMIPSAGSRPYVPQNDTTTFQYDDAGRLVSVDSGEVAEYLYDGAHRRVAKFTPTDSSLFINGLDGQVLSVLDGSGNWKQDIIYLNGRPLAKLVAGTQPELLYFITDHLGTPLALVDDQKSVRWQAQWYPFGEVYAEYANTENALAFPGQWRDSETGLVYNWNRYYSPRLGRYLQPDPLGYAASGGELYGYAAGSPLIYVDPDGQIVFVIGAVWVAAEFALSAYDLYELARTLLDDCATSEEKLVTAGLTFAGISASAEGIRHLAKSLSNITRSHGTWQNTQDYDSGLCLCHGLYTTNCMLI